ncbi:MAG: hypothetical protein K1X52_05125 [Pyrinomonadaceae bacterium]|nr:hypothetical protein [Pyrinomonadaceae bacterium]
MPYAAHTVGFTHGYIDAAATRQDHRPQRPNCYAPPPFTIYHSSSRSDDLNAAVGATHGKYATMNPSRQRRLINSRDDLRPVGLNRR